MMKKMMMKGRHTAPVHHERLLWWHLTKKFEGSRKKSFAKSAGKEISKLCFYHVAIWHLVRSALKTQLIALFAKCLSLKKWERMLLEGQIQIPDDIRILFWPWYSLVLLILTLFNDVFYALLMIFLLTNLFKTYHEYRLLFCIVHPYFVSFKYFICKKICTLMYFSQRFHCPLTVHLCWCLPFL